MESIDKTFGTSRLNVQLKVLHHVKFPIWNKNSKLKGKQKSIWC
jgi:hypothetical protein